MQQKQNRLHSGSISLGDIYYVLFRRKWLILSMSVASVVIAGFFFFHQKFTYLSEAKLLVRYVEDKTLKPMGNESRVRSLDERADSIINSEMQILTSFDLVQAVVTNVGAEKILAKAGGGKDPQLAAVIIEKNLTVEAPFRANVIRVVLSHPDPEIVQRILYQLIESYREKHISIRQSLGFLEDSLNRQTTLLKGQLQKTESQLRTARSNANIISLDDTRKFYGEEVSRIRRELERAITEFAERQAALQELSKLRPAVVNTNAVETNTSALAAAPVPPEKANEYKNLCARLDAFLKRETDLLTLYTPESPLVKEIQQQVAELAKLKLKLEEETPELTKVDTATPSSKPVERTGSVEGAVAMLTVLDAKIKMLNAQLEKITKEAFSMDQVETEIVDLQRRQTDEEARYRYYLTSLSQSRIDDQLSAGKVSNISYIQAPTPPARNVSATQKVILGILAVGVLGSIALAFLLELFVDHSVRHPGEVESRLHLPLMLSFPDTARNGYRKRIRKTKKALPAVSASDAAAAPLVAQTNGAELSLWDSNHSLRPFFEGLRDRLVTYFEVRNLTHKPKLIALSSCRKGAGVSTIAAGLAASLSETGDGNVLLVDMNSENGAAHPFFHGKPVCELHELLENGNREQAMVQDNLYVVRENGNSEKLPRILPKRFSYLVPKLKASDYDYIIFDMPPVSQISVTPRLAGFMDMLLLVVESEKTDREVVQRAANMLAEVRANVGVILNKKRNYVPKRLVQEMPGDR